MSRKIPQLIKEIRQFTPIEINYAFQKSISYSQFSQWRQCPHRWSLLYKDGHQTYTPTIHTVFGTAMHETLQNYLTVMYEESAAAADRIDIEEYFENRFRETYSKEYKANKSVHFSSPTEMREFFDDGMNILDFFKKKKGGYFSKKSWHLVGCELPLSIVPDDRYKNVILKGYIDLVLYNQDENILRIYDIKTSTRGWDDKAKKDEDKQFQVIFYKHYYSKQFGIPEDNIEVEFFIVKRKIWEESEFPQSRIQTFSPASGKIKVKKAVTALTQFIEECFSLTGEYKDTTHPTNPGDNCKYCPFNNNKELCSKGVS
jgi:hypothetical protein